MTSNTSTSATTTMNQEQQGTAGSDGSFHHDTNSNQQDPSFHQQPSSSGSSFLKDMAPPQPQALPLQWPSFDNRVSTTTHHEGGEIMGLSRELSYTNYNDLGGNHNNNNTTTTNGNSNTDIQQQQPYPPAYYPNAAAGNAVAGLDPKSTSTATTAPPSTTSAQPQQQQYPTSTLSASGLAPLLPSTASAWPANTNNNTFYQQVYSNPSMNHLTNSAPMVPIRNNNNTFGNNYNTNSTNNTQYQNPAAAMMTMDVMKQWYETYAAMNGGAYGGVLGGMAAPRNNPTTTTPTTTLPVLSSTSNTIEPFPEKLHRLLCEAEASGQSDVISWCDNGTAFQIHQPDCFFQEIVPRYFKQSRLSSFKRQLNLYGFSITSGSASNKGGSYRHDLFRKDQPEWTRKMRRVTSHALSAQAANATTKDANKNTEAVATNASGGD